MVKKVLEDKPLTLADKKKRLKQLIAFTNKKAGKQVISMATEATSRDRIPFTSEELNIVTGGGIPRGAFSVLWGSKAAGKTSACYDLIAQAQQRGLLCQLYDFERCIAEDTEMFEFKSNSIKKVQDILPGDVLLSFDGKDFILSEVGSNKCNGIKEIFEINTSIKERNLCLTKEHRVFTKRGWQKVKDISIKDSLVCPGQIKLPEICDIDIETSRLVGYMLGDGHMQNVGSYSYATTDKDIVKDISKILKKFSCIIKPEKDGIHYRIVGNKKYKETRKCIACGESFSCYISENKQFCGTKCGTAYTNKNRKLKKLKNISKATPRHTDLKKAFIELGIHGLKRENKIIPKNIMLSSKTSKAACLSGLFSSDGYVNKDRNLISIDNLSKTLLEQIRLLLLDISIDSRMLCYQQDINSKDFYTLTIFGYKNIVTFYKNIKLCKSKQIILESRVKHGKKEGSKDSFEYINKDKNLPLFWNKITSIEPIGKKKVYDIMVIGTESMVINNLLIHNSFDPKWAKNFGIDPEYLALGEFDDAEAGMDNVVEVCNKGLVDLIVIDSIQGMCPRQEFESKQGKEKSLNDDTMALLPRRLSKFFAKAAPAVDNSNCAVVLIGQTRMDLGSFVVLEQLSGGNALQHWSSLTLHCRRGKKDGAPSKKILNEKTEKNETVPIGFEMVAKVNKSKVGPHEGNETRFPFYYGSGFIKPAEEVVNEE